MKKCFVADCTATKPTLITEIKEGWRSYYALAFYGFNRKKVKNEYNGFQTGATYVNGIESF